MESKGSRVFSLQKHVQVAFHSRFSLEFLYQVPSNETHDMVFGVWFCDPKVVLGSDPSTVPYAYITQILCVPELVSCLDFAGILD